MISPGTATRFQYQTYQLRKKFFKIFGASFQIFDPGGQVVFYSEQKAFKLKEDIRVYGDEQRSEEVLVIQARSWLDFAAAYDVFDPTDGTKVGALKRRGFKSMVRDEWIFMDADDNDIGLIQEDSQVMALVRRFVPYGDFVPQKYTATLYGQPAMELRQHFNPVIQKITLDFGIGGGRPIDRRLGLAAGILLSAIEQRQDGGGLGIEI